MATTFEVTDEAFKAEVLDSDLPVLVDFWAEWCGPCKMIAPVLDEIATELNGKLTIGKINVDEEQSTMMAYGIMGIPALLLFKDGELVTRITGFRPKPQLMAELTPHIN